MPLDTGNFDVCFLFCCALESSYLGRLSAIKVQLELELEIEASVQGCVAGTGQYTLQPVVEASVQGCVAGTGRYTL